MFDARVPHAFARIVHHQIGALDIEHIHLVAAAVPHAGGLGNRRPAKPQHRPAARRKLPVQPAVGLQMRSEIDHLVAVKELAQVFLNGKDLGVLWKPPFRVDITNALKPGNNNLEIRVTNLWPNRLIGDAALPKERRLTWSTFEPYKPEDPLLPSGLLGPVNIQAQGWVPMR